MSEYFDAENIEGYIRRGSLKTRAGTVLTPTFMPDGTRGAVKSLTPQQVQSTGVQVVLANTYHLHLQPGEEAIAALGGLHGFTNQSLPLLTDSGGFQVFSLAKVRKITEDGVTFKDPKTGDEVFLSPEISIQIQLKLGADMINAFDDLASLDSDEPNRILEAYERTHRWLDRSIAEFKRLTKDMKPSERPLLFGIVQGGLDKDLRKKSLELVQKTDVDGIAIGGLSVGETRAEMHDMLEFLAPLYEADRPRFLLGVGHPTDLRKAIECGIDMLDCVLPTRNARHGMAWIHKPCTCADNTGQAVIGSASRPISGLDPLRSALAVPSAQLAYSPRDKTETRLECMACGAPDGKIQLTNEQFTTDTSVIDPACDCTTCKIPHHICTNGSDQRSTVSDNPSTTLLVPTGTTRQMSEQSATIARSSSGHCSRCEEILGGYSRGFLRHQFKVGEPLAGTLVSIHNIRYLQRICEEYRNETLQK